MRERRNRRSAGLVVGLVAGLLLVGGGLPRAATNAGEEAVPYVLEVQDAEARVGEPARLTVRVRLREGYRFLDAYRNRAIELSTQDESAEFGRRVVRGRLEGDTLVIEIPVTPTKPGPHVINGVLRIGYAEGRRAMHMISVPLIAKVIGRTG